MLSLGPRLLSALAALLLAAGCSCSSPAGGDDGPPVGDDDGVPLDRGMARADQGRDAGGGDAGAADAGPFDAGSDRGPFDAGPLRNPVGNCGRDDAALPPLDCEVLAGGAHPTLQAALDDPACVNIGVPSATEPTGTFLIDRPVELRGDGAASTVIDGGGAGPVIDLQLQAGMRVVLREITVRNGRAGEGAGVRVSGGSLELCSAVIRENVLTDASTARGGGLLAVDGADVLAVTSAIRDNRADLDATATTRLLGVGVAIVGASARVEGDAVAGVPSEITGNVGTVTSDGGGRPRADGAGIAVDDGELLLATTSVVANELVGVSDGSPVGVRGAGIFAAGDTSRVFLEAGTLVSLNEVRAEGSDVAVFLVATGGGVFVENASLEATGATISANEAGSLGAGTAGAAGGGLGCFEGTVTIEESEMLDNVVTADIIEADSETASGGGAGFLTGCDAKLTDTLVEGSAVDFVGVPAVSSFGTLGGAFFVRTPNFSTSLLVLDRVLVTGSRVELRGTPVAATAAGGAIYVESPFNGTIDDRADLRVLNSTLSGNQVIGRADGMTVFGSALAVRSPRGVAVDALLRNVTITNNVTVTLAGLSEDDRHGAGAVVVSGAAGAGLEMRASILSGNNALGEPDCDLYDLASFTSAGGNALGDDSVCEAGASDQAGGDYAIQPLADNGGPTRTHALGAGSAAIDAADPPGCVDLDGDALAEDQRGEPRTGLCDAGAVEAP